MVTFRRHPNQKFFFQWTYWPNRYQFFPVDCNFLVQMFQKVFSIFLRLVFCKFFLLASYIPFTFHQGLNSKLPLPITYLVKTLSVEVRPVVSQWSKFPEIDFRRLNLTFRIILAWTCLLLFFPSTSQPKALFSGDYSIYKRFVWFLSSETWHSKKFTIS